MKITKYAQSCFCIETEGKRILIDPGTVEYKKEILEKEWTSIDAILVTHKHEDHCHVEAIQTIVKRDKAELYTCQEVVDTYQLKKANIVKETDKFAIGNIKIEVTKAIHGFITPMKYDNREVKENIGFILSDSNSSIYITSDTINFNHNYKCDVLCMPFNGNGLTLGLIDGKMFIKDIQPKLVIPTHMQPPNPAMIPDVNKIKEMLEKENINYYMLKNGETIEYRN